MPRHYDAATKDLIESDPASLLWYLGLPVSGPVTVRNSDLSTVVAESDRVLYVEEDPPWLGHVEIQSGPDPDLALRMDRYNLLIEYRERLPVVSAVLLLRPAADVPQLTGRRICCAPKGEIYREFRYHVVRAWEQSVETILNGPLAMLPLATLAQLPEDQIPNLVEKIEERFSAMPDTAQVNQLRTDAMVLMGLKFSEELIKTCPWRTDKMRESTIYQAILREGRQEGRQEGRREEHQVNLQRNKDTLIQMGTRFIGPPSPEVLKVLDAIDDDDRISRLTLDAPDASSWEQLLGLAK